MCIIIGFNFSWDNYNTQEKLETIILQTFGGETRCINSLYKNGELILKRNTL